MSTPMICTFESKNAPEHEQWMACFYVTSSTPKGKKLQRLPLAFTASTEEAVILKADKFWADEQAKEAAKITAIAARAEKRRAA